MFGLLKHLIHGIDESKDEDLVDSSYDPLGLDEEFSLE